MRKAYLICKLACVLLMTLSIQSCQKENGIDNNSVIKKPYGLYVATSQGALLNTNDGLNYKTIFPPDGYIVRSITTSSVNLMMVKDNLHLSENNGNNFNPAFFTVSPLAFSQQMMLDVTSHERVYLSTSTGVLGVAISNDHGKTWTDDGNIDPNIVGGRISSFTQLKNGTLFGFDRSATKLYKRDNAGAQWVEVTMAGLGSSNFFYISHLNNTVVLTDLGGLQGAWYSNDNGQNWAQYNGLPNNCVYHATSAPFDQVILVATDSNGIYRLQPPAITFQASNIGLRDYTVVYGIAGKEDIYKNGASKKYIYIATTDGIYRSEDLGQSWTLMLPGDFRTIY